MQQLGNAEQECAPVFLSFFFSLLSSNYYFVVSLNRREILEPIVDSDPAAMISFSLSLYQAGSLERMSGTRSSHVPGSLFPPFTTREYKIVDIMKKKEKKEKLPLISFQTFVCACCGMDSIKPFSLLLLLLVLFFSSSGVLLLRDG